MNVISAVLALFVDFTAGETVLHRVFEIILLKYLIQLFGDQLALEFFALSLNKFGKFGVHPLGQVVAEGVGHHEGRAALA